MSPNWGGAHGLLVSAPARVHLSWATSPSRRVPTVHCVSCLWPSPNAYSLAHLCTHMCAQKCTLVHTYCALCTQAYPQHLATCVCIESGGPVWGQGRALGAHPSAPGLPPRLLSRQGCRPLFSLPSALLPPPLSWKRLCLSPLPAPTCTLALSARSDWSPHLDTC